MGGYTLHVWAANEPQLSEILAADDWIAHEHGYRRESRNYEIFVTQPSRVFSDDVPEEAAELVPGLAWFVHIFLEVVTPSGLREENKVASAIARASHGVVGDPQETMVRRPSGVRRLMKPPSTERINVLSLSWWAPGGPLLSQDGLKAFVSRLATILPEAIPGRWGDFEPPNHSLNEEGPMGFAQFLEENRSHLVVTMGRWPFFNEDYRLDREWGWHHRRFRFQVTHVLIELDAGLLDQPGWGRHLSEVFIELSALAQPFYGEARVRVAVDKHEWHIDPSSPILPIRYNWWCGIPNAAPLAAALGDPYRALWPDFGTDVRSGVTFSCEPIWEPTHTIEWNVPPGLSQPVDSQWYGTQYGGFLLPDPKSVAQVWPFEPPPRR